LLLWVS